VGDAEAPEAFRLAEATVSSLCKAQLSVCEGYSASQRADLL